MASSSSSSSSVVARLKNWIWVRQHSDISESHSSIESFQRTTELLVPEEIRGRVVLYDVFISHRGSDGKVHAHIIYENFERLGIKSFFDVEGIFKGENLSAIIVEAIKYSTVFLVLLTKGFAESAWCLEELRLMLEKIKEEGNTAELVPVFYDVEPGDLKNLKNGPFEKAFRKHKKGKEFDSGMVKRWEETLKEVADVPGPCLSNFKGRDKLFKSVVKYVVKRVKNVDMEVAKYPVAIDQQVHELDILISRAKSISATPCIIGIVGMTGIGKSTVAKKLFNLYRTSQSSFRSSLFVDDVTQKARSIGLPNIQKMILKELVLSDADIHNVSHGIKLLKKLLKGTEVLLVLDGVDDSSQLKALMFPEVLSSGSVILVTTPDILLFEGFPNALVYFVKKLERHQSRELLLRHAMQKPESIYPELAVLIEKYLDFCDGVPLSLEVIGRSLSGVTNKFYWKNTLVKVCDIQPDEIKRRFLYYFETLSQVHKKAVLDIACFFDGENEDIVISFWDALNLSGLKILSELRSKSALSSDRGRVYIHSQLKQFVLQALEEVNIDPAHIRCVWRPSDVQKALEQRFGFTNIEYLSLVVKGSQWSSLPDSNITKSTVIWRVKDGVYLGAWPSECFTKMSNLKLLMLEGSCIRGDLSNLPEGILWLQWRLYPYKFLPLGLPIRNLRVLELDGGKLSELWTTSEVYELPSQLCHLRLQGCTNLRSLPVSIGMLLYLQVIVLQGCKSLTTLPEEICNSQSLCYLNLSDCSGLEYLPSNIGDLKKLRHLNMSGCRKLCALPDSVGRLSSLVVLDLTDCWNLMSLPLSVGSLTRLTSLNLFGSGCFDLRSQDHSKIIEAIEVFSVIVEMINLQNLTFSVKGFTRLPGSYGKLLSLEGLRIQGPNLMELPSSLGCLSALTDLYVDDCFNLRDLFHSIGALKKLKNLRISSCGLIEFPEEIGELCNLETFYIRKCESLQTLPTSIGNLSKLKELELVENSTLSISHDSCLNLTLLTRLVINECKISDECLSRIFMHLNSLEELKLQQLPNSCIQFSFDTLPNLISLSMVSCNNLVEFEVPPKLRMLEIVSCLRLKLIVVPTGITMWLRELTLRHCQELSVIRSINMLQNLEKIDTVGCANLHHIQGLELIKTLKEIHIFITYWGFTYHGDEWLQALQKNIYAPAMHFATKIVPNVDQIFRNFHNMEHHSNNLLMFQLPESTVPYSWIMIAFVSYDTYEEVADTLRHLREKARERNMPLNNRHTVDSVLRRGNITLNLFTGAIIETSLHEYSGASAGSTIHFSIFTGDSLLCEQLTSNAIISISSNFSINLGSGWIRMLSIDDESNIETIQSEFFEELREEKERDLRFMADAEENCFSLLLQRRREFQLQRQVEYNNATEHEEDPLEKKKHEEENTATDLPNLKITTRSIADMQCFQALDIANCRIMRFHSLVAVPIQGEHITPKSHKQDLFNLCYNERSLSHLQLEIGTSAEMANAILCTHNTVVQVTVGEDYESFPNIITHEFIHAEEAEEAEALKRSSSGFLKIVFERFLNVQILRGAVEEVEVRQHMANHMQFFADEEGIGVNIGDFNLPSESEI